MGQGNNNGYGEKVHALEGQAKHKQKHKQKHKLT
jgi:hypothetical protein